MGTDSLRMRDFRKCPKRRTAFPLKNLKIIYLLWLTSKTTVCTIWVVAVSIFYYVLMIITYLSLSQLTDAGMLAAFFFIWSFQIILKLYTLNIIGYFLRWGVDFVGKWYTSNWIFENNKDHRSLTKITSL